MTAWCVSCGRDIGENVSPRRVHWGGIDLLYHEACYRKIEICQLCTHCTGIIRYGETYLSMQPSHDKGTKFFCRNCKDHINERILIKHTEPTQTLERGYWE